jgi:3D (Asp-Asp-Asp) domain-containing protein
MSTGSESFGFAWARQARRRRALEVAAFCLIALMVAGSAIAAKEARRGLFPLAAIDAATEAELRRDAEHRPAASPEAESAPLADNAIPDPFEGAKSAPNAPGVVRWFNGRPVRQARQIRMVVTGYSADERSCGPSADGITATLHSVSTNAMRLVAADPKVLRYGSMLSIPGYDDGNIVPVLDCGGAIKGNKLDLLFPSHEEARQWGRRTVGVVVWEYADGDPAENPRRER